MTPIRVRFAPAPTGWMHLGNVRAAYMNALFATQNNGHMILRIEDTDGERIIDVGGKQILSDLAWLGITYNEGPYFQSDRTALYQQYLDVMIQKGWVYRAFETMEELETQRALQKAQGLPPCYNRASFYLSPEEIEAMLDAGTPFVWRFKLPSETVTFHDIARGDLSFDLTNISDFAVTRQDGSFTFMFANFIDDMLMKITHVIRGEDHMTNTACQIPLYHAFNLPVPIFYHLPIICNTEGKKLSKRDFGFSLDDLRKSGFIPEAICNYLGLIGGSFTFNNAQEELMSFDQLAKVIPFNTSSSTGTIHYDVEKLRWFNHKWISRLTVNDLIERCIPFLIEQFPQAKNDPRVPELIQKIQPDMVTLHDVIELLSFYFVRPAIAREILEQHNLVHIEPYLKQIINAHSTIEAEVFVHAIREACKLNGLPLKDAFALVRLLLTGQPQGLGVKDIITMLGSEESKQRLAWMK